MAKGWVTLVRLGTAGAMAASLLSAPARSDDNSAALYKQKCAACHGSSGKGDTPAGKSMKVRSFADVVQMSDDELADAIGKGKGKMPAYGKGLKPDEIRALVSYIRGLTK